VRRSSPTVLASGPIVRRGDQHRATPDSMPTAVRVVWATAATITTPARYHEVAGAAMQLLAEASTMFARFKQANGCNGLACMEQALIG
jgi:hypothetical protein